MTCLHIQEGTCNRGCRGFQCRHRDEQPVGWRVRGYGQFKTGTPGVWRYFDGAERPKVNNPTDCDFEPLYTVAGVKVPPVDLSQMLICPRCKVDRKQAPCPDNSGNCPMVGTAGVTPDPAGLSDEQILAIADGIADLDGGSASSLAFARAILAAAGVKGPEHG